MIWFTYDHKFGKKVNIKNQILLYIFFMLSKYISLIQVLSFLLLFYYSCVNFSPFALLCPSHPPTPLVNSHTVVHVHGSFIHILCVVPFPSFHGCPSPRSFNHFQTTPCFHACGSILFVSLFCSLDSNYRWDHMLFVFHWLAYFTEHNILQLLCILWNKF